MAYTKNPTWVDGEGFTLITAAALNHIEDGISSGQPLPLVGTSVSMPGGFTNGDDSYPGWADRLTLGLLPVEHSFTFTSVSLEVVIAVAASSLRFGLYQWSGSGAVVNRVVDYGAVDASTTGLKTVAVSGTLTRGYYFVATWATVGNVGLRKTTPYAEWGSIPGIGVGPSFCALPGGYGGALPASATIAQNWGPASVVRLTYAGVTEL